MLNSSVLKNYDAFIHDLQISQNTVLHKLHQHPGYIAEKTDLQNYIKRIIPSSLPVKLK